MGESPFNYQAIELAAFNRRKKIMTKRVNPAWYLRYADTLPEDERVSIQPIREIKAEQNMIEAMKTPPKQRDRAEELARKLALERATKIKTVLQLLEGDPAKMKQKLASVKQAQQTNAFKYLTEGDNEEQKAGKRKRRAHKLSLPPGWTLKPNSRWRLLRENKIIRKKVNAMAEELRSERIRHRWQKNIRIVRAVVRFTSIIANIARTTGDVFKEFQEVMKKNRERDEKAGGLCFDRSYYKTSSTGKTLDTESLYTLGLPEIYRTQKNIHKAAMSLRFLRSFAAFPSHFQDLLAKIGWVIDVPADKVIIREGQLAHAFYFLLSGKAVAVRLTGSPDSRTHSGYEVVNMFERDGMFGEEGVIERGFRTYTVTSIETCTLLSVNIDDYNRLCLEAPSEDDNPDHIRMLSQLDFMRYFPMKKLIEDADGNIILFYFKPGSIVTTRLSTSNYLYVIKTGTCRVLCQVPKSASSKKRKMMKVVVPPKIAVSERLVEDHDGETEEETGKTKKGLSDSESNGVKTASFSSQGGLPPIPDPRNSFLHSEDGEPEQMETGSGASKTMKLMEKLKSQWEHEDTIAKSIRQMNRSSTMGQSLQKAGSIEKFLSAPGRFSRVAAPETVWINLKTLREADVIGIEDLDLADVRDYEHPKVSVVSDGSEVILISKKYFMDNASPKMRASLRASSYIMPDEETLRLELQRLQYWKSFKNKTVRDLRSQKGHGKTK